MVREEVRRLLKNGCPYDGRHRFFDGRNFLDYRGTDVERSNIHGGPRRPGRTTKPTATQIRTEETRLLREGWTLEAIEVVDRGPHGNRDDRVQCKRLVPPVGSTPLSDELLGRVVELLEKVLPSQRQTIVDLCHVDNTGRAQIVAHVTNSTAVAGTR